MAQLHLRVCDLWVLTTQGATGSRPGMSAAAVEKSHPPHLSVEGLYLILRVGAVVHRTLCLRDRAAHEVVAAHQDRFVWDERFSFALPPPALPVAATPIAKREQSVPMHAPYSNDGGSGEGRSTSILTTPCVRPDACSPLLPWCGGGGGVVGGAGPLPEPQAAHSYLPSDSGPRSPASCYANGELSLEMELWSSSTLAERCIARAVLPLPASPLPATAHAAAQQPRDGPHRHTGAGQGSVQEHLVALQGIDEGRGGIAGGDGIRAPPGASGQARLAVRVRFQVTALQLSQGLSLHARHAALVTQPAAVVAATATVPLPTPGPTTIYPGPPTAVIHAGTSQPHYLLPTPPMPPAIAETMAHTTYSVFSSPQARGVLPPPLPMRLAPGGGPGPSFGDSLLPPPPSPPRM